MKSIVSNILFLFFLHPNFSNSPADPLEGRDVFTLKSTQVGSWLGHLKSDRSQRISNVPMFILRASDIYAKIICVPTNAFNWNSKFKGKSNIEKNFINKTLVRAIQDRSLSTKQLNVIAFVQLLASDSGGLRSSYPVNPKFPSKVFAYSSLGAKWVKISEKLILNEVDYGNFQYQIAKTVH